MELGLGDARVLVTGGATNIGRGVVRAFAREGARVLVADLDGDGATEAARDALRLGAVDAAPLTADLTSDGAGRTVAAAVTSRWGGVDVLVNNVGWSEPGWFADQTDRRLWEKTVAVNLYTAIDCTQHVVPSMREAGRGAIVFLSSDAAFGAVRQGIYGATKAGLISLARTVARENGRYGIRSNVVAPGLVLPPDDETAGATSVWARGVDAMFTPAQIDSVVAGQALRRRTTSDDVGAAVVWLSSEVAARQITGQVLAVGGGSSMP